MLESSPDGGSGGGGRSPGLPSRRSTRFGDGGGGDVALDPRHLAMQHSAAMSQALPPLQLARPVEGAAAGAAAAAPAAAHPHGVALPGAAALGASVLPLRPADVADLSAADAAAMLVGLLRGRFDVDEVNGLRIVSMRPPPASILHLHVVLARHVDGCDAPTAVLTLPTGVPVAPVPAAAELAAAGLPIVLLVSLPTGKQADQAVSAALTMLAVLLLPLLVMVVETHVPTQAPMAAAAASAPASVLPVGVMGQQEQQQQKQKQQQEEEEEEEMGAKAMVADAAVAGANAAADEWQLRLAGGVVLSVPAALCRVLVALFKPDGPGSMHVSRLGME
ncbi:hypothetical protein MNEG_5204 [Monoraphidium neglectum]|uniref:Uncharacterized protein n=1 Tax=Monoraphidium neglectum TaxID=145388 RepID=A0A0D2L7C9_9CHLO|nr:hypothetical protein MNEG_5204 [Monoraphidium neglectum]KIZ02754.1 hypothetical protein MNEG_5204 [Monoraphidium neglectum]|eukprot:XP_013901773.1 hypothetical protein MNEG_5204 [Monoraphidium neglectum]